MRKYDNYKDSGVEWIGQIPVHWEIKKLNRVCQYQIGGTPSTGNMEYFYGEHKWLNISDINNEMYIFDTEKRISAKAIRNFNIPLSPKDSLLFSFKLSIGQVCFAGVDLYTNEAVATFLPDSRIHLKYAYYMFPICVVRNAKQNIYGADLLNQELIAGAKICYPHLLEQQQIADYLDNQTAKIDELVQKQNKLIETLKEKKKSLINHVVTKGLNPDVPMKDSGVEWLGQIPAHWVVKKLKYSVTISNGQDYKHVEDDDGIYPVVGSGGEFAKSNAYLYNGESILLGRKGTIDKPLYFIGKFWTVDTMFYTKILPSSYGKFIYYQCINIDFNRYITSTVLPSMTQLDLNNISLASPSLLEQQQISEYLDQQTSTIDELINKAKSMVSLLKEHKQSLINNVVTGKINVTTGV